MLRRLLSQSKRTAFSKMPEGFFTRCRRLCSYACTSQWFLIDLPSEGLCVRFGDALMAQLRHSCSAVVEMVYEMQCHLRVYHNAILAVSVCIWLPSEKYLLKVIPYSSSYKI